jgi:hypothetical protein
MGENTTPQSLVVVWKSEKEEATATEEANAKQDESVAVYSRLTDYEGIRSNLNGETVPGMS